MVAEHAAGLAAAICFWRACHAAAEQVRVSEELLLDWVWRSTANRGIEVRSLLHKHMISSPVMQRVHRNCTARERARI